MKRALLGACLGAFSFASGAQAEDFSVGGYKLSDVFRETGPYGGESWDEDANHRKWSVTETDKEPVRRFEVKVTAGKVSEPPTEKHRLSVYATEQGKAFLIDFSGALDSNKTTADSPDFIEVCARDVEKLGGATRSFPLGGAGAISIIVDRDLPPEARAKTLAAIDKPDRYVSLTNSFNFKDLTARLGPDFRGAIVECGWFGLEPHMAWNTRFLDLPLAAKVFNLAPE